MEDKDIENDILYSQHCEELAAMLRVYAVENSGEISRELLQTITTTIFNLEKIKEEV